MLKYIHKPEAINGTISFCSCTQLQFINLVSFQVYSDGARQKTCGILSQRMTDQFRTQHLCKQHVNVSHDY